MILDTSSLMWAKGRKKSFEPGIVSGYPAPRARTPESFPTLATNEPLTPGTYCCYIDPVEDTPDEEVTSVDEFVAAGGEAGARSGGTLRIEGKDYEIREGDVVHFRVGA